MFPTSPVTMQVTSHAITCPFPLIFERITCHLSLALSSVQTQMSAIQYINQQKVLHDIKFKNEVLFIPMPDAIEFIFRENSVYLTQLFEFSAKWCTFHPSDQT